MSVLIENRFRVRTLLGVNMVVEAGAGTGKTTLLIDRLCFALLAQGVGASRLVALTFTEKAAAEMKTRLIFKLQHILSSIRQGKKDDALDTLLNHFKVSPQDIISRAEQALAQLDRSPMGTIHSFCADILRAFPLEAGLSPNAEIDTGVRSQFIFETEWNQFLEKELGEDASRPLLWKEVLEFVSLKDLRDCAQEMCSGKIEEYRFFAQKEKLIQVCQERAKTAEKWATAFLDEKKKERVIETALKQASRRFLRAAEWLKNPAVPVEKEETIVIRSVPKDWEESATEEAKALCRFAAQADPFVQTKILKAYDLLLPLVKKIRLRYQAEGVLSFDDLIVKTRNLLRDNLFVRRSLQEKYDVFFIDEFQDTDPVQGEIILFLAAQKGSQATRWQEVELAAGKLFVVGDPKQSIYRFRGADITAYQLFTDLILKQGGEKAFLRQNFRSEAEIISLANEVCSVVMQPKPAFQPQYEPIFTDKKEKTTAVEIALIAAEEKFSADNFRHNQARFIAQWIEKNVGKRLLRSGQVLQYKDIAILTRNATTAGPYMDALRREGIAFAVAEDRDFYHRQEMNDFLNLLRAIDNPQDQISLVGVMRSPLGGMTDEEILIAAERKELDWRIPSSYPKQEALFALLRAYGQRWGREPLAKLVRSLFRDTFLPQACAAAYEGEKSIATLEKLVSWAENYVSKTPLTFSQFLAHIQKTIEQELGNMASLAEGEGMNAVHVMTVHRSKGLEFPIVFLADISRKETASIAKDSPHLYSWRYDLHGLRVGKYADINLAWLEEEQREHAACEEIRVLYVALTRAREKLILVGNQLVENKTIASRLALAGCFPPADQSLAFVGKEDKYKIFYTNYQDPTAFIYRQKVMNNRVQENYNFSLWQEKQLQRKTMYEHLSAQRLWLAPSEMDHADLFVEQAASLGSFVHAVLARWWQNPQLPLQEHIKWVADRENRMEWTAQVQELLSAYEKSVLCQKWRSMKTLGVELPFVHKAEKTMVHGIIDLLLQDEQGTIWIVDYKTDDLQGKSLEQAAQKYQRQMAYYKAAVQAMYPSAFVKSALVFVRYGQMQEV